MPLKQTRILVVEDNRDNMTLMSDMLETLDYTVLQATDGHRGLELAASEQPDLILMDLSLPVMDGWTAARDQIQSRTRPYSHHRAHGPRDGRRPRTGVGRRMRRLPCETN